MKATRSDQRHSGGSDSEPAVGTGSHAATAYHSRLTLAEFRDRSHVPTTSSHQDQTHTTLYFHPPLASARIPVSSSWDTLPLDIQTQLFQCDRKIAQSEKANVWRCHVSTESGIDDWVAIKRSVPPNESQLSSIAVDQDETGIRLEYELASFNNHPHLIASVGNFIQRSEDGKVSQSVVLYPLASLTLEDRLRDLDKCVEEDQTRSSQASVQVRNLPQHARLSQRLQLIDQMACLVGAVHYLHDQHPLGCVKHRDIKPENILLDHKGNVVLADFDIAMLFKDRDHAITKGATAKTEAFANRSVLLDEDRSRGPERDVNSLGFLFMETVTAAFGFSRKQFWASYYPSMYKPLIGPGRPKYGYVKHEDFRRWLEHLKLSRTAQQLIDMQFGGSFDRLQKFLDMILKLCCLTSDDRCVLRAAWEIFDSVGRDKQGVRCAACQTSPLTTSLNTSELTIGLSMSLPRSCPSAEATRTALDSLDGPVVVQGTSEDDLEPQQERNVSVRSFSPGSTLSVQRSNGEQGQPPERYESSTAVESGLYNISGHAQAFSRSFGLWSLCAVSIVADNAWGIGSGALVVALSNGGGPGVLYGLIAATVFYSMIGACLAELGSSMPSSGNVFHWAYITAGSAHGYGRATSFFAGWWNFLAWTFGTAAPAAFGANAVIDSWTLWHPGFEAQRWHMFLAYVGVVLVASVLVVTGQRYIAPASNIACGVCLLSLLASILVVVSMTANNGTGYASSYSVWQDFQDLTGWQSAGFVFLMGMVNGAFAIGTPDGACHLLEETRRPHKNLPVSIFAQLATGFVTTFLFYIALLYGINDYSQLYSNNTSTFPLATIYQQATNNTTATTILLVIYIVNVVCCLPGAYISAGRMLYILARDNAAPGSEWLKVINPNFGNPLRAHLIVTALLLILGAIYIGSLTAFYTFVGLFCILTTASYVAAILPNLLTCRLYTSSHRGVFWMPGWLAYPVMAVASAYILIFNIIYMFPSHRFPDSSNMNYSCVVAGGCTILISVLYLIKCANGYKGPRPDWSKPMEIELRPILEKTEMAEPGRD